MGVRLLELLEAAVLEPEDAVGDVADAVVVGDDDDRAVLRLRDIVEELDDFVAVAGVEVGGRFVGEDELRVVGQGAGDRDALALAAGEGLRLRAEAVGHAEVGEEGGGALAGFAPADAGEVQGDLDVLAGVEGLEQVEALEDEAEIVPAELRQMALLERGDFAPVHTNGAGSGAQEAADKREEGRLAGARGAHDQHEFAAPDAEVDAVDGVNDSAAGAEALREAAVRRG